MNDETMAPILAPWSSFYAMTGSAAAALTGLMFVVITLVAERNQNRSTDGTAAFSTPTVVHFCAAILLSAILSAPWHVAWRASIPLGIAGTAGMVYVVQIIFRARRLEAYTADAEDVIWHWVLPFIAYLAVLAGALRLTAAPEVSLFAIASAAIGLVFVGIHNAWDIVTYLTITVPEREESEEASS